MGKKQNIIKSMLTTYVIYTLLLSAYFLFINSYFINSIYFMFFIFFVVFIWLFILFKIYISKIEINETLLRLLLYFYIATFAIFSYKFFKFIQNKSLAFFIFTFALYSPFYFYLIFWNKYKKIENIFINIKNNISNIFLRKVEYIIWITNKRNMYLSSNVFILSYLISIVYNKKFNKTILSKKEKNIIKSNINNISDYIIEKNLYKINFKKEEWNIQLIININKLNFLKENKNDKIIVNINIDYLYLINDFIRYFDKIKDCQKIFYIENIKNEKIYYDIILDITKKIIINNKLLLLWFVNEYIEKYIWFNKFGNNIKQKFNNEQLMQKNEIAKSINEINAEINKKRIPKEINTSINKLYYKL